jgi:hypothetical protein
VWALADDELRKELALMVAQAADVAILRMLREQPFVRRRRDGEIERVRAGDYVAVSALHTTARLGAHGRRVPDPQLHLHYLLIGAWWISAASSCGRSTPTCWPTTRRGCLPKPARRAMPSTKEAVGERPIGEGEETSPRP